MVERDHILALRGASFRVANKAGGHITVEIPHYSEDEWPGEGAEGFAFPVNHEYRGVRREAILKAFRTPLTEREKRTGFFVNEVGLVNLHDWMFDGAPMVHVNEVLNGVHVQGHIAQWISKQYGAGAKSLSSLFETTEWTNKPATEKKRLAAQVAEAVCYLESEGVAHGDLSENNVMIGAGPRGQQVATLIDYDGFYAAGRLNEAPLLPVSVRGDSVRTFGSPGMQYPELCARFNANDLDTLFVETDRFALAALACTIVAWTYADAEAATKRAGRLRMNLLDKQITLARSLDEIDPNVIARFPQGFALLERALLAATPQDMPPPEDWVRVLGGKVPTRAAPVLQISRYVGSLKVPARPARLISDAGDFSRVDSRLSSTRFRRDRRRVHLDFDWPATVYFWDGKPVVGENEMQANFAPASNQSVALMAGQEAYSNGWRFKYLP